MFRSRRLVLIPAAGALLVIAWWRHSGVKAAMDLDPNVVWAIGKTENSADEFAPGAAKSLEYTVGKSSFERDWRQRQDAGAVYTVRFPLAAPEAVTLQAACFYVAVSPEALELTVNGRRGRFRVLPEQSPDLDERDSNTITHSRQTFRIPLDPRLLRAGDNELRLSFTGEGGTAWWDSLALVRGGAPAELEAAVEPTIFYRRAGDQLREVTQVVLRHSRPLGEATVALHVGGAAVNARLRDDGFEFGEHVSEVDAPALSAPAPYTLTVKGREFRGQFRPEKRWRIFAGLKIHNDIGYTDLQPHVQELDNRNTDQVLDILARNPFYKFSLETGWLVDNYTSSRSPARVRQLMDYALKDRVGINAMYLNLMTGTSTGEELYRSLYYANGLRRKYGIPMKFACLTDAPSHTWFVPTLLADAGVKGFANGSNQTRAPLLQNSNLNEESPFWWQGPDGSKVLTWFARSYLQLQRLTGENPTMGHLGRTVSQFLARYRRGDYPVDAVLLYGLFTDNADIRHGHAETIKQWNDTWAFPRITPATDGDYYAYIAERFADKIPVLKGDAGAYWEDGAASSAAETTINRDTQRLLPAAEMAAAFGSLFHASEVYPADEFREAWKNLLFYDEHTWGASNSVSQPDRTSVSTQWEFKRAYAFRAHWAAKDLAYRSLNRLVQNISVDNPTMFVFNPDLWPRTGVVELEIDPGRELVDLKTGAVAPLEVVAERDNYQVVRFVAEQVPGLGYRAWAVRRGTAVPARKREPATSWTIESRYYRLRLDPSTGAIAELIDKELNRNLADPRAPYRLNEMLYVSGGERSRILQDMATLPPPRLEVAGQHGAKLVENTGRRIVVRAAAPNVPEIETEISLSDAVKRVDIRNRLRKEARRAKEAVYFAFPFAVSPPELAYQIQNAWVRPNTDQLPGAGREWFTTQNVIVARDAGTAIAWATPDAPLVTLTDINRGNWPRRLDVKNGWVFSYAMNNYWFTNYRASQGGDFTFRYAITSARTLGEAELARFDAETRSPLIGYPYYQLGNVREFRRKTRMAAAEGTFLSLDAPHAQVTAFKEAENGSGFILRVRETAGQEGTARLASPVVPLTAAYLANGVEDNLRPLKVAPDGIVIPLKPHRFTTVRLVLRRAE